MKNTTYFVTVSQRGYSDSQLHGPFSSVDEGKRKLTDGEDRGYDGDETMFTFHEMSDEGIREVGYVLFDDESESDTEDLKKEHFPNV
jgi:hypothetical protein